MHAPAAKHQARTHHDTAPQAAAVCLAIRGVAILTNIISATSLVRFLRKRQRSKDKKQNMWERLTRAP
jgi:hypothetical protein